MEIKRYYTHRGGKTNPAFGLIADVTFTVPDGEYTFDGKVIHPRGVEHLMNFCLQTLQDVYAGASDKGDAVVMCLAPGNQAIKRQINTRSPLKVLLGYANVKKGFRK